MNALLDKAIKAIARLPESEQEAIARDLLERIDSDERWHRLLADPLSKAALRRLADDARAEIASGAIVDADPSTQ